MEVYVVEKKLFEKSGEHYVVAAYSDYRTAADVRDNLGGCGGRVTTVPMYMSSAVDNQTKKP